MQKNIYKQIIVLRQLSTLIIESNYIILYNYINNTKRVDKGMRKYLI